MSTLYLNVHVVSSDISNVTTEYYFNDISKNFYINITSGSENQKVIFTFNVDSFKQLLKQLNDIKEKLIIDEEEIK